jgi:hypothetical protein
MSADSGYLVETKTGKQGRTYHRENKINGKIIVYVEGEADTTVKLLCNPETIKIIGYVD